jgi:putative membrane protein insertion efficiency factor
MSPAARTLSAAVRAYQFTLAPVLGGQCRFTPSCSNYAREALATHGALQGSRLAAWRVLRCSPFCAGGHDPVPPAYDPPAQAKPAHPHGAFANQASATPTCSAANPEAV